MRMGRNDSGAAAVEFALIVPVLLAFFCGIIDLGLAYSAKTSLTHGAREGVRVWALTQDSTKAMARTREAASPVPADSISIAPLVACSNGASTTLTATYDYSLITPVAELLAVLPGTKPLGFSKITLTSKGVMACGG